MYRFKTIIPTQIRVSADLSERRAWQNTSTSKESHQHLLAITQTIPASKLTAYSLGFGYCSLGLEQSFFRAHDSRATELHRLPQAATGCHRLQTSWPQILLNLWKSIKIYGNLWKSLLEIYENQWKSIKVHESLWKSIEIYENLWKSMKVYEIQHKI